MLDLFSLALARLQHCVFKKRRQAILCKGRCISPHMYLLLCWKTVRKDSTVYLRLDKYFASSGMVDMYQEGFTKNRNTIRYLNRLNLHIKSGKESGNTVIGLFLDFEKAFDSVWKKALMVKLFDHGVNGVFLGLVNTFLFSRKVSLKVNSFSGPSRKTGEYGLPQGSVLSPLLFKFYVSDLLSTLQLSNQSVNTLKFADDMTVVISDQKTKDCIEKFVLINQHIVAWCNKWRMVVNCASNKTEYVCFSKAKGDIDIVPSHMPFGHKEINRLDVTCVLGLYLDQNLNFIHHSDRVYSKLLYRWTSILKYGNNQWGLNQRVMRNLIKVLFLPTFDVWWHALVKSSNITSHQKSMV